MSRADEHRHAPAHRFGALDHGGRQRPSEHVLLGRRDHGGAVLRRDALRPARSAESRQRSLRAVEGTRRADPVRRLGRSRHHQPRATADAAAPRFRPRRTSDAAAAVGRRRDRIARPGTVRRRRHRAQRAPHRLGLPHLRAARRRRDGRRLGLGGRARRVPTTRLDSLCGITDVNALGQSGPTQWQHDIDAYAARWRAFGWHAIVVDGHDLPAILDALEEARRHEGPADDDPGADDQGQGHLVHGRQGRLARQGAQEGRGAGQGARRAAVAVRARGRAAAAAAARRATCRVRRRSQATARRRRRTSSATASPRARRTATAIARLGAADDRDRRARRRRQELDVQREVRAAASRPLLPELHRRAGDDRRGDGAGRAAARFRFRRRSPRS